jgi:integrase
MRAVIFPALGHFQAMAITPARLDAYVAARLRAPKNKNRPDLGTIKRTTVHRELSDIRAVLNWAARRRFIPANPSAAYEMPKRDDAINLPPSLSEIAAILRNAPDRLARALVLSFYCGLRPGVRELFSLRWSDVDFDASTIAITSARKNGLRARIVPIHRSLRVMLETWRAADSSAGLGSSSPLIHDKGRPVGSLKKSWATAKRRAGISRRLPLYSLRHAFATESLRARGDLKAVSSMLGHTRTETTTRIYQHLDDSLARDAVDRLPDLPPVNPDNDCPPDRRTIH